MIFTHRLVKKRLGMRSLITDSHCQVIMERSGQPDPSVFAIGDCAIIDGQPLPATAQGMPTLIFLSKCLSDPFFCTVANQKAKYLTKKLNKIVKGKEHSEPFVFHNMGSLAYVGDWHAVFDRSKADTLQTKEAGRLAWLLWRSAYFTRTLSIRNK
jgi:NADH dehydrogenase FAD-containing subunit